ncbi:MAG: SPOR domain-containing protein [Bacillota bacterium]|jgi:hypothetical protein
MPSGQKKSTRPRTAARGPKGITVFLVFLLLAVLCITGGFALGRYLLSTLGENLGGTPPPSTAPGTTTPGTTTPGAGGTGGETGGGQTGGGALPAGGGAGSRTCQTSPLAVYSIQIGAFSSRANAESAVRDLASKNLPGFVVEPSGGSTLYRVRTVAVTKREVADAVIATVRSKGYPDSFLVSQTVAETRLTLSGSSVQYLERAVTAIETLVSCLRIEGDIWDRYRSGTLDRATAATRVDSLITAVREAREGLSSLQAPSDLAALGDVLQAQLISASTNLQALKSYLAGQSDADRIAAESSYIGLVEAFLRLEAGLGS